MERAVDLNRLLLKFVLLCQVNIQERFREVNAKFNLLEKIWEIKMSWRVNFSGCLRA